jgi:FkbM family methyltransferase
MKTTLHAVLWWWRHRRGRYLAEESSAIQPLIHATDICLDIGAHAGSWTLPLAKLVPEGQVYAFEALPYYASVLMKLVRFCGLKNVIVLNRAVSDQAGAVEIAWRTKAGTRLTGNTHVATGAEKGSVDCVTVEAITLDGWQRDSGKGRIGFIKIDVEGAELLVLKGGTDLIKRDRPIIFMEIVTSCCARYGYEPDRLFELFSELGYGAYTVDAGSGSDRPVLRPSNARTYSGKGDVLIIPSERAIPEGLRLEVGS